MDEDLRDYLVEAIGLEQIAALAYSTAAGESGIEGDLKTTLETFGEQEEAHASALRSAIDELGFDPPDQPDSPSNTAVFDDVEGLDADAASNLSDLLSELDGLKGRDRLLEYLAKVEEAQLDYYLGQGPGLDSEDLATTSAEISGCQAQHLVVLREQLGDPPPQALTAASERIRSASAAADDAAGRVSSAPEPRPVSASRSELIRWMGVQDANAAGFVHGGVVMKTCDEAAAIAAIRHCGRRVVTAGVDRMTFVEPIAIGQLLTCQATVNAAWRTSMEVGVRVEAEDAPTRARRHTTTAYVTMVALDEDGRPCPVPDVIAETPDEERRQREAELRRANRLAERDQILGARERG